MSRLVAALAFQAPWVPFVREERTREEIEEGMAPLPESCWCIVRTSCMLCPQTSSATAIGPAMYMPTTIDCDLNTPQAQHRGQKILDHMLLKYKIIPPTINVDDLLNHPLGYLKRCTWFEVTLPPPQLMPLSPLRVAFPNEDDNRVVGDVIALKQELVFNSDRHAGWRWDSEDEFPTTVWRKTQELRFEHYYVVRLLEPDSEGNRVVTVHPCLVDEEPPQAVEVDASQAVIGQAVEPVDDPQNRRRVLRSRT